MKLTLYEAMDSVFFKLENIKYHTHYKNSEKKEGQSEEGRSGHCRNCFLAWPLNLVPGFFVFHFFTVKVEGKPHCMLLSKFSGNENSVTQANLQR